ASNSALNSYQLGADVSLSFPTLLIPGWLDHYFAYPTTTTFKFSGQRLNRAGYYGLNSLGLSMSYDYQPSEYTTHNIRVLSLEYSNLAHTTEVFDTILADNPSLSLSMRSQFIPSIGYTYTWNKRVGRQGRNSLWLRGTISEAGNITKGLFVAAGKPFGATQHILGVPYAQFVKAAGELRYTRYIDRLQSLATRLSLGAIYSYGNARRAPYMEQFYVGGANSIRAFTVRSLGPGRFRPSQITAYTFMDHVGELKLEANLEFRRRLIGALELGLFVDAGNVWLLRPDVERPGAAIGELGGLRDFLEQIAVGTGLGLRYDAGYLLLRIDAGIGLHLPYATSRSGWYNIPRFSDGFGLHLAIGYPF
ncbi:MAG: BamA/TamA family outer membrane protein, partial [Porphyromonas sp.]|nr:BamA/TamA family outer membrane protein [Porphyromonas sp.]